MVCDTTLYELLDVSPNATDEQITKGHRKQALLNHPDRGGDPIKMQQINIAKEVLSDPKKRDIYDKYGPDGLKTGGGPSGFPGDIPSGMEDILAGLFGHRFGRRQTIRKGDDRKHVLKVSLEELYLGCSKKPSITRHVVCTNCNGTGCQDGIKRTCTNCDGQGVENVIQRMGPFIQQMQRKCSSCNGQGDMITPKNRCKTCYGQKISEQKKILDVEIARGSQDKQTIKYSGEGDQIPNGIAGDVYIILHQQPHPTFERNGDNLTTKLNINLAESLCGFQRLITLLDGHKILINHPSAKPIVPNSYRCLKGHGMPNRQTHELGDLIIHFDVEFPRENFIKNQAQVKQLEAILPSKHHVTMNAQENVEEVQMEDCESPPKYSRFQDDDGPDGDEHSHSDHVQCQTQ